MISPALEAPTTYLATLAPWAAQSWRVLGIRTFPGELTVATNNSTYRFRNGIFLNRARKPARAFEAPATLRGMRFIGFLRVEAGRWALTPVWSAGSHAVLWRQGGTDEASFLLTSPTQSSTLEVSARKADPGPEPSPWLGRRAPAESGVMLSPSARPPAFCPPAPPSMTRLHVVAPPFDTLTH